MSIGKKYRYGDKLSNFSFQKRFLQEIQDCCGEVLPPPPAPRFCYSFGLAYVRLGGTNNIDIGDITVNGITIPLVGINLSNPTWRTDLIAAAGLDPAVVISFVQVVASVFNLSFDNTPDTITLLTVSGGPDWVSLPTLIGGEVDCPVPPQAAYYVSYVAFDATLDPGYTFDILTDTYNGITIAGVYYPSSGPINWDNYALVKAEIISALTASGLGLDYYDFSVNVHKNAIDDNARPSFYYVNIFSRLPWRFEITINVTATGLLTKTLDRRGPWWTYGDPLMRYDADLTGTGMITFQYLGSVSGYNDYYPGGAPEDMFDAVWQSRLNAYYDVNNWTGGLTWTGVYYNSLTLINWPFDMDYWLSDATYTFVNT